MSEEQSALQKDVEKQAPLRKEIDFFQSVASLASLGTLGTVRSTRIPEINGIVILIYVIFSVTIVVGMVSLKTCSFNVIIPIYLILAGSTGIAIKVLMGTTNRYLFNVLMALISFYCIWHVVGSYFVFKDYDPLHHDEEGPYCSRLAYMVAFWLLVLQYVLFVIFTLLYICNYLMRTEVKT